jgi:hypothetical protein
MTNRFIVDLFSEERAVSGSSRPFSTTRLGNAAMCLYNDGCGIRKNGLLEATYVKNVTQSCNRSDILADSLYSERESACSACVKNDLLLLPNTHAVLLIQESLQIPPAGLFALQCPEQRLNIAASKATCAFALNDLHEKCWTALHR